MVGKYVDHLPFYRQIQMFKRIGISLPPSSIEAWFHEVADLMRPAYYRFAKNGADCYSKNGDAVTVLTWQS